MNKISDLKVGDKVALMNGEIDTFIGRHKGCSKARFKNDHHVHNDKIDWQKTNELNNKQMDKLTIEAPTGMEVYQENNTIKFRNTENKLPMSVEEITNRNYWIHSNGEVTSSARFSNDKNNLSTEERAEAFLALMQLVELRDAWNGDSKRHLYLIYSENRTSNLLSFKTLELRNQFGEQFKDLIETAKELL